MKALYEETWAAILSVFLFLSCFAFPTYTLRICFRLDLQHGAKPKIGTGDRDETLIALLSSLSLEGLGPQWSRPIPPRLPVQDGEVSYYKNLFLNHSVRLT